VPLSFSQERLWFIDQLEGSVAYHMPIVLQLEGALDIDVLRESLQSIISRHEVLRSVIHSTDGVGYQEVLPSSDWDLSIVSLEECDLEASLSSFIASPFDLSSDYMLRMCLYDLGSSRYVLAGVFHHISSDGWSNGILVNEFVSFYSSLKTGSEASLPVLPIQYSDYAIWQRKYLEGSVLEEQLSYWEDQLSGHSYLELPTDYARPSIQSSKGHTLSYQLPASLSADLSAMSKSEGVTLFMLLLGAFKVLLYKYSGQEDICVGTPIANRTQRELEGMIGFFVNTLALRSSLNPEATFSCFLKDLKNTTLSAYDHQSAPFEKVVDRVVQTRDMSRSALFQVMFELQNAPTDGAISLEDLSLSPYYFENTTSQFDITMTASETPSGISLEVEYCTDLFKESSILRLLDHYQELLGNIVSNIDTPLGRLSMLTDAEEHLLLEDFNSTSVSYPLEDGFVELFKRQVLDSPDAIAGIFEDQSISYQELDSRSNQVAHYLHSQGIVSDDMIGICLDRSLEMLIGIIGILKSGGCYVPIKPDYPASRIAYILGDISSNVIITDVGSECLFSEFDLEVLVLGSSSAVLEEYPDSDLGIVIPSDSLSYVIYTSGSTGVPKGAMIEHAGMLNHLLLMIDYLDMDSSSVVAFTAPFTFDISVWQLLSSVLCGGHIVIYSEDQIIDSLGFKDRIYDDAITILQLVPSYISGLLEIDSVKGLDKLSHFLVTGEAVSVSLLSRWFASYPDIPVVNAYGPTEASDDVSLHLLEEVPSNATVSIGKPVSNLRLYVVDCTGCLCPVGVMGELWVSGIGVGRGYVNDPVKTALSFDIDPFVEDSSRLYKTGDLARWLSDGSLEFLGRKDDQVKIRGHRIELGEIENVLSDSLGVLSCCVLAKEDALGNHRLVGYVACTDTFDKQDTQAYLQTRLPEYMVPLLWVTLDEMPLTSHGKIDKKALPDPDMSELSSSIYVAASTDIEKELVTIWQELLGVEQVGVHDNFFELGG
uniref:non-ribosomal peptide synthetase n=1 Tax=Aquimarina longa TaxID=1080221 RepID=UPI000B23B3F1